MGFFNGSPPDLGAKTTNAGVPFKCFFSNISSLSPHAKEYISSLSGNIHLLASVEVHKDNSLSVESFFNTNGYSISYNVPEKANVLSHGGELIAVRKHLNSRPVQSEYLESVAEYFMSTLRFSARMVVLKGLEVLFLAVYLWASEGFSQRNQTILKQMKLLIQMLDLPFLCMGDFNITFKEFAESEWPDFLGADTIDPQMVTTTTLSTDRPIDFALISKSIKPMFASTQPIYDSTWKPHYSNILSLHMRPIQIRGKVLCKPKPLPMKQFQSLWKYLDEDDQGRICHTASNRAKKLLQKHKRTNGVAILGQPCPQLDLDVKFQGNLKQDCIRSGEALALASLTAEMVVLDVC